MSVNFNINPNNIYIYIRVSTNSQVNDSNGLDNQHEMCEDYINKNFKNNSSVSILSDVGSSYQNKNKLTNLNKLIRKIESNSLIVVGDISRLGRNIYQVFSLLRKIRKTNSHIIGVQDNLCYNHSRIMDKKFYYKIIEAELSSDKKSLISLNRINNIKKHNGYIGRASYGTQIIKKNNIPYIYKKPSEIKIIELMKSQFILNNNYNSVSEYLNNNNFLNRKNIQWTSNNIKNILNKYFPNLKNNINTTNLISTIPDYEKDNEPLNKINNTLNKIEEIEKEINNLKIKINNSNI